MIPIFQTYRLATGRIQQCALYFVAKDTISCGIFYTWRLRRSNVNLAASAEGASAGCWQWLRCPDLCPPQLCWAAPAAPSGTSQPTPPHPTPRQQHQLQRHCRMVLGKRSYNLLLQTTWSSKTTQNWLAEQQHVHAFIPNGLHNPIPIQDFVVYGHMVFILWEQTCSVLEDFLQATVVVI